jgi:hypothetical protein
MVGEGALVTTVALWHLGVTAVLAGVLSTVMLLQGLAGLIRRQRRGSGARTVITVVPRQRIAPVTLHLDVPAGSEPARPMASSGGQS